MRILHILPEGETLASNLVNSLQAHGIESSFESPTLFSAFTSMKISSLLNKSKFDWIHCYNPKDAISAISARKITKGYQPKIILEFLPNDELPKRFPSDLTQGVNAWLFSSSRQKSSLSQDLRNTFVIPKPDYSIDWANLSPNSSSRSYLWIDAVDKNIQRLKDTIQIIDDHDNYKLLILGTGKARFVMDAVRKSRGMNNPQRVEWLGENFDLPTLLNNSIGIVKAQEDLSPIELSALERGWEIVVPVNENFIAVEDKSPTHSAYDCLISNLYNGR